MRNKNTLQHPKGFVHQLIDRLAVEDKEIFNEIESFFTEHLLLVMDHELFEQEEYRAQYSNLLFYIKNIAWVYKQYTAEEIEKDMRAFLEAKNRKEVAHA